MPGGATPAIAAPEVAAGIGTHEATASVRSDVYSLGATADWCLAGERAYAFPPATDLRERFAIVAAGPPPHSLRDRAPHIPLGVARAVERAMSRNPADRFATVLELPTLSERAQPRRETGSAPTSTPLISAAGAVSLGTARAPTSFAWSRPHAPAARHHDASRDKRPPRDRGVPERGRGGEPRGSRTRHHQKTDLDRTSAATDRCGGTDRPTVDLPGGAQNEHCPATYGSGTSRSGVAPVHQRVTGPNNRLTVTGFHGSAPTPKRTECKVELDRADRGDSGHGIPNFNTIPAHAQRER